MLNKLKLPKAQAVSTTPTGAAPLPALAQQEYLGQRYFAATVAGAALLHIMGLYVWYITPSMEVVDIPVHALSIKLGDGEPLTQEEIEASQPNANTPSAVDNAISQSVTAEDARAAKSAIASMEKALTADSDPVDEAIDKAMAGVGNDALVQESRKLSSAAKQFVRTNNVQARGSVHGTSTAKDAELMSRYEQLISQWIEKFKQYPMEAREQNLQGETVVRIRIDRKGNIRYYILEHSTGNQILDKAAIEMVRRANPVPAVPNDYPKGDLIEFLIPVNFHLQ